VISNDSLFLASSLSVRFLTGLFSYVIAPWDQVVRSSVVFQFSRYILPTLQKINKTTEKPYPGIQPSSVSAVVDDESFIDQRIVQEFFPFFAEGSSSSISKRWATLSIIDLERDLEQRYRLGELQGERASLQAFRDVIIDFSKKEGGNLHKFMEWWEQNGNKLKVQTSVERDAIRIVTIHKSKGLEFPFVLIPFCDWKFEPEATKTNILWCPANENDHEGFPVLPVNFSKILMKTSFARSYFTEMLLSNIDNLNLLYVAFTRAVDGLFLFSKITEKGNAVSTLFNDLIVNEANDPLLQDQGGFFYSKGELMHERKTFIKGNEINLSGNVAMKHDMGNSLRLHKNYEGFFEEGSDNTAARINEGKLMHELLSLIETRIDISLAVEKLIVQGLLDAGKKEETLDRLNGLLKNQEVQNWFDGSCRVLNEASILSPKFDLKRPDRVMIRDSKAIVVDYKTTATVSDGHRRQVANYVSKIKEMGFEKVEGYVWYLNNNLLLSIEDVFIK
jgi:hypothetical protein